MNKNTIIALAIVAVAALGALAYFVTMSGEDAPRAVQTFVSDEHGIGFEYPEGYALEEREEEGRHVIVLADAEALAEAPQNGEGPTSITIEIYDGALDGRTLERWIREAQVSNFQLSPDGVLTETSLAGEPALAYGWDGLYRGNSIALSRGEDVYVLSVTYLETSDQIRADFAGVAATFMIR